MTGPNKLITDRLMFAEKPKESCSKPIPKVAIWILGSNLDQSIWRQIINLKQKKKTDTHITQP